MRSVAIVGDALLDVTVAPFEPMRPGGDVPAAIRLAPGGQGANVAVRLARRGIDARLACGLADDAAGTLLRAELRAEGVTVLPVAVDVTGTVAVLVDDAGERTMLSQRAAFVAGVDVEALCAGAAWLVVSGYALLEDESPRLATRCAALHVRRAVLGCDVGPARVARWRDAVFATRPDLVIMNRDEEREVGDLAMSGALILVTDRDGVGAIGAGLDFTVDAPRAGAASVDTTGAGDAFAAAILAALGTSWPPDEPSLRRAIEDAAAAARTVVSVPGAQGRVDGERVPSA
jgi:sugar/nucleoside kinase (ribokinase family)